MIATHPEPGAGDARRADADAARGAGGAALLPQHRAAAHRRVACCRGHARARASWNFLRRRRRPRPGHRHLRPDPAAAAADPRPTSSSPSAARTSSTRRRSSTTMEYEHPLYTPESVAAQPRLPECDTDRIVFAGAYHGWGFHEDGARSGLEAAERLGCRWSRGESVEPRCPARDGRCATASTNGSATPRPRAPASTRTTIRHTRRTPFKRTFTHRVAHLAGRPRRPARPRRARSRSRPATTSATPTATIREQRRGLPRRHGVDLHGAAGAS